jgi:hypothetical protein
MRLTKPFSRASISLMLAFGVLGLVGAPASVAGVMSGEAHLEGPKPCPQRPFRARLHGERVARVTFALDGNQIGSLTRTNFRGTYSVRINPRHLRLGVHRLVARVTFERGGATKGKRLRLAFQRCPRALRAPRFTG